MESYPELFTPLKIGNVLLRNRIIAAPITKYNSMSESSDELEALAAKARGGAAMVMLGSIPVDDDESLIYYESSSLWGRKRRWYLEELAAIHQYGAKAEIQLFHGGMFADTRGSGKDPVGPQAFHKDRGWFFGLEGLNEEQTLAERDIAPIDEAKMEEICQKYAASAREAKALGFDVVMLHFAHGWLAAQFLSPFFNRRSDKYGGSLENRARFPLRILQAVREAVGPGYPLDMRMGMREYIPGGLDVEEALAFLKLAEPYLDMVHISSGLDKFIRPTSYIESPCILPHQINVPFAARAKETLRIPVAVVGGISMPDEAKEILSAGKADLIAMGRALIADPNWPNKARSGRTDAITPCLRCVSCYGVATDQTSAACAVNPCYERALRLKAEYSAAPARKRVVVVGGGPAGMVAAITAAERGHDVILLEKEPVLGGILCISDEDPVKVDMHNYLNHLRKTVATSKVDVRMEVEATPELVRSLNPEALVIAVGSEPVVPKIPGVNRPNVVNILKAHGCDLGERIAIIGAGPSACELALSELQKGKQVTIILRRDRLAPNANHLYRAALHELFDSQLELKICTRSTPVEINDEGVWIRMEGAGERLIPADSVVLGTGMRAKSELAESFYGIVYDARMVGDCVRARRINEAHSEGYFAAMNIGME